MPDITINHIAGLEVGGHLARSVLAREVNFATASLTVTNKVKTGNTVTLTISNTISPFLFVGQAITISGVGADFDVVGAPITAVNSGAKQFSYVKNGPDVGSSAATGTATPTWALGLTGGNQFPQTNSIAGAGDAGTDLNKIILAGRRAVYYTNLSNYNAGLGDTINKSFSILFDMRMGTGGSGSVDCGILLRESATKIIMLLMQSNSEQFKFFDGTTISVLSYTGTVNGSIITNSTRTTLRFDFVKDPSTGKLINIRITTASGAEYCNISINSAHQLTFPLYVGDAAGKSSNSDDITKKSCYDLIKLLI